MIKFFTACCSGPGSDRTPLRLNKVKIHIGPELFVIDYNMLFKAVPLIKSFPVMYITFLNSKNIIFI